MDDKTTTIITHSPLRLSVSLRTAEGLIWSLFFEQSPIIIGRSAHCDLRLPYPWISLQHVEVTWSDFGISARDLYAKTPVHIKGDPLQPTPTLPSQSMCLSFPSLSVDLQLDQHSPASNAQDKAITTRHLWRPESGWLLWSPNQSQITVRQISSEQTSSHNRPPEPIFPHQWQEKSESKGSEESHKRLHGQCWFLNEFGQYVIAHGQEKLQLVSHPQSLSIHGSHYALSPHTRSIPISLGEHNLALTQSPHPPTEQWINQKETTVRRKWWSIFLKT